MEQQQETPQDNLTFIANLADMAAESMKRYGDILNDAYMGKIGNKGKLTVPFIDKVKDLTDQYSYLKTRVEKLAKRSDFKLKFNEWIQLSKLHFNPRKTYKNIAELKYTLADALFWTVEKLDAAVLEIGTEFLRNYDPENAVLSGRSAAFAEWVWLRVRVVLELLMLERSTNGISSTTLAQRLPDYLRGYLITDESYEMYQRRFYQP